MKKSMFPLRWFTDREIGFAGVIVGIFVLAVPHWLSLAASIPVAIFATWMLRKEINSYQVKPWVTRLLKRGKA